jgi:hypothetical protein
MKHALTASELQALTLSLVLLYLARYAAEPSADRVVARDVEHSAHAARQCELGASAVCMPCSMQQSAVTSSELAEAGAMQAAQDRQDKQALSAHLKAALLSVQLQVSLAKDGPLCDGA